MTAILKQFDAVNGWTAWTAWTPGVLMLTWGTARPLDGLDTFSITFPYVRESIDYAAKRPIVECLFGLSKLSKLASWQRGQA